MTHLCLPRLARTLMLALLLTFVSGGASPLHAASPAVPSEVSLSHVPTLVSQSSPSAVEGGKKVSTKFKGKSRSQAKPANKSKRKGAATAAEKDIQRIVVNPEVEDSLVCLALCQIGFSGYDKRPSSKQESLFVTNSWDHHLKRVKVRMTYTDLEGNQIHSEIVTLECDVPPGETRNVTYPSWDKQGSFYYQGSTPPKTDSCTPFDIRLEPLEYHIRK